MAAETVQFLNPDEERAYDLLFRRFKAYPPLDAQLGELLAHRFVNALIDIEDAFCVPIDVDEAMACRTVRRLLAFVAARVHPTRPNVQVYDLVAYRAAIGRPIRAEHFA